MTGTDTATNRMDASADREPPVEIEMFFHRSHATNGSWSDVLGERAHSIGKKLALRLTATTSCIRRR